MFNHLEIKFWSFVKRAKGKIKGIFFAYSKSWIVGIFLYFQWKHLYTHMRRKEIASWVNRKSFRFFESLHKSMNFQFSNVMCMLYVVCFVEKDLKFVSQNNIKISRKITSFLVYSSASTNKQPEKKILTILFYLRSYHHFSTFSIVFVKWKIIHKVEYKFFLERFFKHLFFTSPHLTWCQRVKWKNGMNSKRKVKWKTFEEKQEKKRWKGNYLFYD